MAHSASGCSCAALDRRHFLALTGASMAAAFLAACSTEESPGGPSSATPVARPTGLLFRNVRVLDVRAGRLGPPTDVSVRGNLIGAIGNGQRADPGMTVVDGRGRTLMPGLIDNHVHLLFGSVTMADLTDPDKSVESYATAALKSAHEMLLRGFTSVRDLGGPVFPAKAAIDGGKTMGPRIWPSGAMISQTGGHGDFRTPEEQSRRFTGKRARAEELNATFIVDGRDEVLTAARENLRMGATQLKLAAGGGTSSAYDPIDVTQFTFDEMRAGVEAADDWNTYVTVHAYTPKAVRRSIAAGVKCVEHGQLLDQPTLALMAERGVWLSGQYLVPSNDSMSPERREKRKGIVEGNARVWPWAKQAGVKLAWGTDFLFDPAENPKQNSMLLALREWFSPAELLRLATLDNAALLGLSGPRNPYPGALGVVEPGALADLILVDGDPLAQLDLIAEPGKNFSVIVKDGVIYKDA